MKLSWRFLIPVALVWAMLGAPAAVAQPTTEIPSRIVFSRTVDWNGTRDRVHETYSWGTQTLPAHRIAAPNPGFAHHTFGTVKPAGTTTQVLRFRFRSNNLFAANPGAHFAVVGRAESTSWYNRGRGFIVGGLSGCSSSGISVQPETWFSNPSTLTAGNHVWNGAPYCAGTLSEGVWYDVDLHVNSSNHFAYTITQGGVVVAGGFAIHDTFNPEGNIINNKLTGFSFGLVFADNFNASWTLEFDNITSFWFAGP
ncbi:MAG: hypothetical protein QE485_17080 [Acidovorax sp.]|uniref:hypothetical protein n=1 Tax=Acidovorax sp. TaxID=1872122 RepID=UPI002619D74A|nr:hypothetical protein [Acidovorax sp.]MDH4418926.1 hypothetical protein [Acidovorax sp.]